MKHAFTIFTLALAAATSFTATAQVTPPTGLHDSVPYQGDEILINPVTLEVIPEESKTLMECDWVTLMGMVRDLETRIATALEVDTVLGSYAISEQLDERVWMRFDCYVLRDSVISLQVQLDDALASEPVVETRSILSVAQTWANLRGAVTEDGNAVLQLWGFKFGTDSTLSDSIVVPFGDYANFLDTSAADTGSFVYEMGELSRYTQYFYAAFGANEEGPGYGDTLSFTTLPDLASGLTLDTADVGANSAKLELSIEDAGGQGPDTVRFYYSAETFIASAFAGDSLASDSTGGTEHTVVLSGLTRFTDYYFNAMVENLAGRAYADENFLFKTLPDLATLELPTYSNDSLFATITDNGGQTPTSYALRFSGQADMSDSTLLTTTLTAEGLEAAAPTLEIGTKYYVQAVTENNAGSTESGILYFATPPTVTSDEAVSIPVDSMATITGSAVFSTAIPTEVGVKWGTDPTLATADTTHGTLDTTQSNLISATIGSLTAGTTYYYRVYATNDGGTVYGGIYSFCAGACYNPEMDGYTYDAVRIGCDCWFAENLQTTEFLNGDAITETMNSVVLTALTTPGTFVPGLPEINPTEIDSSYLNRSGRLYNAYAMADERKMCPSGWHVPSETDWDDLSSAAVAASGVPIPVGETLVGKFLKADDEGEYTWNGEDLIGFNALPGGFVFYFNGNFNARETAARWWSSTPSSSGTQYEGFQVESTYYIPGQDPLHNFGTELNMGASIRCLADDLNSVPTVLTQAATDADSMSVTLHGELLFGGWGASYADTLDLDSIGFIWSKNADLSDAQDTLITATADSTFAIALAELDHYTTYYYAFQAVNENGTGSGEVHTFQTAAKVPTLDLPVFTTGVNNAKIHISDFGGPEADTIPTTIYWGTDPTLVTASDVDVVMSLPDSSFTANLPGLDAGADYYVRGAATNEAGTGRSAILRFATALDVMTINGVQHPTDTTATLTGAIGYTTDYAAPDSVGFRISTYKDFEEYTDTLVAVGDILAADTTFTMNLNFTFGQTYYYKALGTSIAGRFVGDPWYFCAGKCPDTFSTDAHTYAVTRIGCDCYFAENLREVVTTTGDSLPMYPLVTNDDEDFWDDLEVVAAVQQADSLLDRGIFYHRFSAANAYYSPRMEVCPPGWHTLRNFEISYETNGINDFYRDAGYTTSATRPKVSSDWRSNQLGDLVSSDWAGNNTTGFNALATGLLKSYGDYDYLGTRSHHLVQSNSALKVWRVLTDDQGVIDAPYSAAYPIRCVQDRGVTLPSVYPMAATDITTSSATLNGIFTHGGWLDPFEEAEVIDGGFVLAKDPVALYLWLGVQANDPDDLGLDSLSFADVLAHESIEGWMFDEVMDDLDNLMEETPSYPAGDFNTWATYHPVASFTDTMTLNVTGLEQDSIYYFLPIVRNAEGYSFTDDFSGNFRLNAAQFTANLPHAPIVETQTISTLQGANLKVKASIGGDLLSRGNLTIDSLGVLVGRRADLDSATQITQYNEVNQLVFNINQEAVTEWTFTVGNNENTIASEDLENGTTYYYTSFAANAQGLSTGDTLMHYQAIGFQPGQATVGDSSATLTGRLFYNDNPPASAMLYWSTSENMTWPDSSAVTLLPDTTFTSQITYPEALELGSTLYYQVAVTNDHGTFNSVVNSFCTGACPSVTFDGFEYETIKYGCDCWFTDNLRTTIFSNGDTIGTDLAADAPAQVDSLGVDPYGRYYNTYAVNAEHSVCPYGTHVADRDDWDDLKDWFGGSDNCGPNIMLDGHNTSGFSVPRAGNLDGADFTVSGRQVAKFMRRDTAKYNLDLNPYYAAAELPSFTQYNNLYMQYAQDRRKAYTVRCVVDDADALPEVTTGAPSVYTLDTAVVSGTINRQGVLREVTGAGILFGTDAALTNPTELPADTLDGTFVVGFPLVDVTEGDTLYYAAYAETVTGRAVGATVPLAPMDCESPELDQYTYAVVQIQGQCWFAENLRSEVYNNGDSIPGSLDDSAWMSTLVGAQSLYGDSIESLNIYGRLYNGRAVYTGNLCPTGWHVPTFSDVSDLGNAFNGLGNAGAKLKAAETDSTSWDGDNQSGLTVVPAGRRDADGTYGYGGENGYQWTSDFQADTTGTNWYLRTGFDFVSNSASIDPNTGYSVRCLRDTMRLPEVTTLPADRRFEAGGFLNGVVNFDGWSDVTETGFVWSLDSTMGEPSTIALGAPVGEFEHEINAFNLGDTIYFTAYATNAIGTAYGDTLRLGTTDCVSPTLDGYSYDVVELAGECWFAENLRTELYQNGDSILNFTAPNNWASSTDGGQGIYDGDSTLYANYGRLYNWYAAGDERNICPTGWEVPSSFQYRDLLVTLGQAEYQPVGTYLKAAATDSPAWNGSNSTGFSAAPAGIYLPMYPLFSGEGDATRFWASNHYSNPESLGGDALELDGGTSASLAANNDSKWALSVRCIKESADSLATVVTLAEPGITDTLLTMQGKLLSTGGGNMLQFKIQWGTSPDLAGASAVDATYNAEDSTFTLGRVSFDPSTTYYYSALAISSQGYAFGDTLSFTTLEPACGNDVTYNGYDYATVLIGNDCWFAENLRTDQYNDGVSIPGNLTDEEWLATTEGAQAVNPSTTTFLTTYGRLYNGYAVSTGKLCPTGWRVPTRSENYGLISGMSLGTDASGWDVYGLVAAGFRYGYWNGSFIPVGISGRWWSSEVNRYLLYAVENSSIEVMSTSTPTEGFSVRCIRD